MKKRLLCILLAAALLIAVVAISASAATDTSANEKEIYTFLTGSLGLNSAAACGVMANIYYETGYRADISVGTYYGLFMYYGPLAATLKEWCGSNGCDYTTVSGQMAFFKAMMEGNVAGYNYSALLSTLRSVSNTSDGAYAAGDAFCRQFERPANLSYEANKRGSYAASTLFAKYQGTSSGGNSSGEVAASYTAYVTASELNVRSGPGTGYSRTSSLYRGNSVSVVAESSDGGWCKLSSGGWVSKSYLSTSAPSDGGSSGGSGSSTYYVSASALNVRSGAGTDYGVVDCLYNGASVSVTEEATCSAGNPWGKLSSGGWVCKTYLTTGGSSGSGYQVTASALNVRSGAGMSASVIGSLQRGASVTIVATAADGSGTTWGQLVSGGWVSMDYVA